VPASGFDLSGTIAPGQYSVRLSGIGTGSKGGEYSYSAVAVPEPGEWAMLLAGFSMIGFMVRRRRN